jgi:hypothetical protein
MTMAYPVDFRKDVGERWLEALRNGDPIEPPDGRWTINAMMALAGLGFFGAMSHGPLQFAGENRWAWDAISEEHREAREDTLFWDLHATLEFYGRLFMNVKDGTFDEQFEPRVQAVVYQEDGESRVGLISGGKTDPDGEPIEGD